MSDVLAGKTAIISGGSGGIAGGCARALAKDGATVVLWARGKEALEKRRAELLKLYPKARVELFLGDAFKAEDVRAAMKYAHGLNNRLDIIVALAGGGAPPRPLITIDEAVFRDVIERNTVSAFMAIRYGAPYMKRGGSIVCISSTAAKINFPWLGPYCAAKAAIESLVKSAAEELGAAGIKVNAVRPGLTRANNTSKSLFDPETLKLFQAEVPNVRPGIPVGEPDDIGGAVRFLAGPESPWVTGQSIAVDGGNELRKGPDMRAKVIADIGQEAFDAALRAEVPR